MLNTIVPRFHISNRTESSWTYVSLQVNSMLIFLIPHVENNRCTVPPRFHISNRIVSWLILMDFFLNYQVAVKNSPFAIKHNIIYTKVNLFWIPIWWKYELIILLLVTINYFGLSVCPLVSIVGSLRDREVACSASDRQGSNFESCVWKTVSSQSSHQPQKVFLAQFSLYVHKGGLKPDSFHFISVCPLLFYMDL